MKMIAVAMLLRPVNEESTSPPQPRKSAISVPIRISLPSSSMLFWRADNGRSASSWRKNQSKTAGTTEIVIVRMATAPSLLST